MLWLITVTTKEILKQTSINIISRSQELHYICSQLCLFHFLHHFWLLLACAVLLLSLSSPKPTADCRHVQFCRLSEGIMGNRKTHDDAEVHAGWVKESSPNKK